MQRRIFAMSALIALCHSNSYAQDAIAGVILDWNKKCGILSGKTLDQFSEQEVAECSKYAKIVNDFLGFPSGGGFHLTPEARRTISKRPLLVIGEVKPCNKSGHDARFSAYVGSDDIGETPDNKEICTQPIPRNIPVHELTCEVTGGGIPPEACGSAGNISDCSYAATISLSVRLDLKGNRYCWWAYNQSDKTRTFSISIK